MKEKVRNSDPQGPMPTNLLAGFRTHASRTMMLSELGMLLDSVPGEASPEDYSAAVLEENALLKGADAARKKSLRFLRELYLLNRQEPMFRALKLLGEQDPSSLPLMALLAAVTRDNLLRSTVPLVSETPAGTPVNAEMLSGAVADSFPDLLAPGTLAAVGRNAASSWTQSGHLEGRSNKVRSRVEPSSGSVVYALYLGHLTGVRGLLLYETLWARLLDAPDHELDTLAFAGSQRGWMEYRRMGEVAEFGFSWLEGGRG